MGSKKRMTFLWICLKAYLMSRLQFDEVQLKRGVYYPRAHGEAETELRLLRHALLNILYGTILYPMDVTGFPGDPAAFDLQRKVNEAILKAYQDGCFRLLLNQHRRMSVAS